MPDSPSNVSDPKVLRALAHGVRNRILAELSAVGPMRAADLAVALEIPANQASFHLRTLAKYGLIIEAPEEARDGRDRVWKPARDRGVNISLKEIEAAPGGEAVSAFLRKDIGQRAHEAVDSATGTNRDEDTHISISDIALRLTKDEAAQLALELSELADGWRERTRGRGSDRRTYALLQILQPHPGVNPEAD
jgi:DNA-binding transcriptional ArsR family regulator